MSMDLGTGMGTWSMCLGVPVNWAGLVWKKYILKPLGPAEGGTGQLRNLTRVVEGLTLQQLHIYGPAQMKRQFLSWETGLDPGERAFGCFRGSLGFTCTTRAEINRSVFCFKN